MCSVLNTYPPPFKNKRLSFALRNAIQVFIFLFAGFVFNAVTLNAQTATISVNNNSVCENGPEPVITFTGTGGIPEYSFYYSINGGLPQTSIVSSGNTVQLLFPTTND